MGSRGFSFLKERKDFGDFSQDLNNFDLFFLVYKWETGLLSLPLEREVRR